MESDARTIAQLEQRVSDLDRQIARMEVGPLRDAQAMKEAQAVAKVNFEHLEKLVQSIAEKQDAMMAALAERDKLATADRKDTRRALYAVAGTLGVPVITGAFALILALLH